MNHDLQNKTEQYSVIVNDLQEQQADLQQQVAMQGEELDSRDRLVSDLEKEVARLNGELKDF